MKDVKTTRMLKVERVIWWIITVIITAWSIWMLLDGRSTKAFMGLLTILSLIGIGSWQLKGSNPFPSDFAIMTYGFIFVSVGLGTFGGAYKINHFDDFLHLTSGIWIGYGAWVIMQKMIGKHLIEQMPKAFIGLYVIMFALAVAGLWELLEFAGDKLFHFTAQGRDPDDTMFDMIDGLIGGTIAAIFIIKNHGNRE